MSVGCCSLDVARDTFHARTKNSGEHQRKKNDCLVNQKQFLERPWRTDRAQGCPLKTGA